VEEHHNFTAGEEFSFQGAGRASAAAATVIGRSLERLLDYYPAERN
jgi:hypothetical protein